MKVSGEVGKVPRKFEEKPMIRDIFKFTEGCREEGFTFVLVCIFKR